MKIAVGGKGGCGKTTVAGTLARVLAERGQTSAFPTRMATNCWHA